MTKIINFSNDLRNEFLKNIEIAEASNDLKVNVVGCFEAGNTYKLYAVTEYQETHLFLITYGHITREEYIDKNNKLINEFFENLFNEITDDEIDEMKDLFLVKEVPNEEMIRDLVII